MAVRDTLIRRASSACDKPALSRALRMRSPILIIPYTSPQLTRVIALHAMPQQPSWLHPKVSGILEIHPPNPARAVLVTAVGARPSVVELRSPAALKATQLSGLAQPGGLQLAQPLDHVSLFPIPNPGEGRNCFRLGYARGLEIGGDGLQLLVDLAPHSHSPVQFT